MIPNVLAAVLSLWLLRPKGSHVCDRIRWSYLLFLSFFPWLCVQTLEKWSHTNSESHKLWLFVLHLGKKFPASAWWKSQSWSALAWLHHWSVLLKLKHLKLHWMLHPWLFAGAELFLASSNNFVCTSKSSDLWFWCCRPTRAALQTILVEGFWFPAAASPCISFLCISSLI